MPLLLAGNAGETCVVGPVTVLLTGDSTQVGMTADAPGKNPHRIPIGPAEMLQTAMDQRFGVGAVVVVQAGAAGSRAGGIAPTVIDRANTTVANIGNTPQRYDISVANFGINDMLGNVPIDYYAESLKERAPTIYETPNPTVGGSTKYAEAVRKVAGRAPIADVDAYVRSLPNWQHHLPDGIHPSAELYAMISRNVLVPAVEFEVTKLRCHVSLSGTQR